MPLNAKVEPPSPPSSASILAVMFHKHVHIARKRCRLFTSAFPVIIYCSICVFVLQGVTGGGDEQERMLVGVFVPLFLGFAVSGVLMSAVVEIVSEKETKMKAVQQIYGLSSFLYWASWGVYYFFVALVCIAIMLVILQLLGRTFLHASPYLLFVILLLAYFQQYAFAAVVSVFFDVQRTASSIIGFLAPFVLVGAAAGAAFVQGQPRHIAYLVGLLPGVNMMLSLQNVALFEFLWLCDGDTCHNGLNFHTLWATRLCIVQVDIDSCPQPQELSLSPAESIFLMFCATFLYMLLAWWLDNVWPSEFGAAQPCGFCCRIGFWCPARRVRLRATEVYEEDWFGQPTEEALRVSSVVLTVRELRKEFKDKKALDGLTLDVDEGEIFALLGHNGAGKTTAINCIIGMVAPTSGWATVNGFDIVQDVSEVRRQLTICPQDNPMYDWFTVRQHLTFFGSLRGVKQNEMRKKTREVLTALGMPEKLGDLCTALSGGQKRRLWVATALLGQTPLTFLDEPTSGMDPASRRELWGLLLKMRGSGVSIIFTTHYLEEADALAERKAVLARGKVQAIGTSLELKRKMGLGYHLYLEMATEASSIDTEKIRDVICRHIPTAYREPIPEEEQVQAGGAGMLERFMLPYHEVGSFGPLFGHLDAQLQALQVSHYSVAMTSLEEVFMALGRQAEHSPNGDAGQTGENTDFREVHRDQDRRNERAEVTNYTKRMAMARVRITQVFSNREVIWSTILFPIFLVLYSLLFVTPENNIAAAIFIPMAFGVSAISYSMMLIHDKKEKCKYVVLSQGMPVREYWLGGMLAHYTCGLPVTLLVVGLIYRSVPQLAASPDAFALVLLQSLLYPVSILLYAYNMSTCFDTTELAAKVIPWVNILGSTIPPFVVQFLWSQPETAQYAQVAHVVMSALNPIYPLPGVIVTIGLSGNVSGIVTDSYFLSWCAVPLYISLVTIPCMVLLLVLRDSRTYSVLPGEAKSFSDGVKDNDVFEEEARIDDLVKTSDQVNQAALLHGVRHTYRTKIDRVWQENHAVRGISYGVHIGECFGLLGPNGAGKTTTFSVLTGLVRPPSAGKVMVLGCDMEDGSQMQQAFRSIGVCPQEDPLFPSLTGRQHLRFFGMYKGVPSEDLEKEVDSLLYRLGFDDTDANKKANTYSGGMKRKLSLAIALIGRPPVLFLDEPSAAVDAAAKRHLWKVIKLRTAGQSVILTTHSMEEAEALCDRIAIQVKGQLRCLGPPQHIKRKYGSGYQIEIFCQPDTGQTQLERRVARRALVVFMREQFTSQCVLLERHASRFLFQLPPMTSGPDSLTLGKIFLKIQESKTKFRIADYTVSQPSLEQVFLRFAREQEIEDHDEGSSLQPRRRVGSNFADNPSEVV